MQAIKWHKLAKRIPARVKVGPRTYYEVLWVKQFDNKKNVGESRPGTRQIIIDDSLSSKEKVLTFFHEWLHSISDSNLTPTALLTEQQVSELETRFQDFKLFFELFEKGKQ